MAVNKYFSAGLSIGSTSEQRLLESLIIESIQIYGEDCIYLPRDSVKPDTIFGEDILSQFTQAIVVEMYLNNITGWEGNGELMSKFGIQVQDEATFVIARRRWSEAIALQTANLQLPARPAEGDLIYYPKTQAFFEITFVDHLSPFYQLGKFNIFSCRCSLFRYSSEPIKTGNDEIDQHALDYSLNQLDYLIHDQQGNPLIDNLGNPIIGVNFDGRAIQPTPNDIQDIGTEAHGGIVDFTETNPFGEV